MHRILFMPYHFATIFSTSKINQTTKITSMAKMLAKAKIC